MTEKVYSVYHLNRWRDPDDWRYRLLCVCKTEKKAAEEVERYAKNRARCGEICRRSSYLFDNLTQDERRELGILSGQGVYFNSLMVDSMYEEDILYEIQGDNYGYHYKELDLLE